MVTYIAIASLSFLAGVIAVLLACRRRRKDSGSISLDGFNFDKQKKYEKDGRKYPFSY
ncbi:transmembrane spermine/spermidine synthase family protein [Pseudodesulfovibrio mercurii]|uniref:Transmembrane spermine/spermidine synthase family protein n=1 Tax=Pseudodesulfovibrio mercurii TaxID=641491 RepID=F0JJD6_9BACT|nr:transmembrane spermine/spermidine synthase family protein [Pseudodesulfovibrio mercurii]EGB16035.1 transmembrane spermine/spermidine synthase family protein [Pseudodesulfovibrio mercurii]